MDEKDYRRENSWERRSDSRDGYSRRNEGFGERRSNNYGNRSEGYGRRSDGFGNRSEGYRRFDREEGDRPRRFERNDGERRFRPRIGGGNFGDRENRSYSRDNFRRDDRPRFRDDNQGDRGYGRDQQDRPRFRDNRDGFGDDRAPRFNRNDGERRTPYRRDYDSSERRPFKKDGNYDPTSRFSRKKQMEYQLTHIDPNAPIRLNKYLANAGICSRREADEFIPAGVVTVNGEVVTELGTKVMRTDVVKFHDQVVSLEKKVYILVNKPKDCVTTVDDPQERHTVLDLVKGACDERIYPVGRLDRNTTGVLLLTNDGELASKLTHPKYKKKKIYHVTLDKNLSRGDLDQIATGIELDDGPIRADAIEYTDPDDKTKVGIEIHSGRNRIVRRIFEALGYRVKRLDRVLFAGLTKKGLQRGDWRFLTEREVSMLYMGAYE